jgi:23S rRNA (uracil1939-C5)-methyltransferase
MMLVLESSDFQPLDFSIEELAISVVQVGPRGSVVLAGSDHILMDVSGKSFKVSASSFFQVNTHLANSIVKNLLAYLPLNENMTVVDVYCGVGLFSAFLASKVKHLVGIELSPEACADFAHNLDEFDHVDLYEASAEDVLSSINFDPDIIVMDPPREGLGVKVINSILAQSASTLVYISCDPATMARDARRLTLGGYKLVKVELYDMFPQTYHLESVTCWEKA